MDSSVSAIAKTDTVLYSSCDTMQGGGVDGWICCAVYAVYRAPELAQAPPTSTNEFAALKITCRSQGSDCLLHQLTTTTHRDDLPTLTTAYSTVAHGSDAQGPPQCSRAPASHPNSPGCCITPQLPHHNPLRLPTMAYSTVAPSSDAPPSALARLLPSPNSPLPAA